MTHKVVESMDHKIIWNTTHKSDKITESKTHNAYNFVDHVEVGLA